MQIFKSNQNQINLHLFDVKSKQVKSVRQRLK